MERSGSGGSVWPRILLTELRPVAVHSAALCRAFGLPTSGDGPERNRILICRQVGLPIVSRI
jgi:hypothetical protein